MKMRIAFLEMNGVLNNKTFLDVAFLNESFRKSNQMITVTDLQRKSNVSDILGYRGL